MKKAPVADEVRSRGENSRRGVQHRGSTRLSAAGTVAVGDFFGHLDANSEPLRHLLPFNPLIITIYMNNMRSCTFHTRHHCLASGVMYPLGNNMLTFKHYNKNICTVFVPNFDTLNFDPKPVFFSMD